MQVVETPLPGVKIVQPVVHRDPRGFFLETYHHQRYTVARWWLKSCLNNTPANPGQGKCFSAKAKRWPASVIQGS